VNDDVVYIHVSSEGTLEGRLARREFVRAYPPSPLAGASSDAIAWTTSASVVSVIQWCATARLPQQGFLKQETDSARALSRHPHRTPVHRVTRWGRSANVHPPRKYKGPCAHVGDTSGIDDRLPNVRIRSRCGARRGMSGICMGIQLRKHGIDDFVILEKADSVAEPGGENTYPGVACDVPSHVLFVLVRTEPNWMPLVFERAPRSGITASAAPTNTVSRQDPLPHARDQRGRSTAIGWHVETEGGPRITADIVVSGLGGLHLPNRAAIDGIRIVRRARVFSTLHRWRTPHRCQT
jgi:hypothetical protein